MAASMKQMMAQQRVARVSVARVRRGQSAGGRLAAPAPDGRPARALRAPDCIGGGGCASRSTLPEPHRPPNPFPQGVVGPRRVVAVRSATAQAGVAAATQPEEFIEVRIVVLHGLLPKRGRV
jgi:hypothetical protein